LWLPKTILGYIGGLIESFHYKGFISVTSWRLTPSGQLQLMLMYLQLQQQ